MSRDADAVAKLDADIPEAWSYEKSDFSILLAA